MSRGLGKIERLVLAALESQDEHRVETVWDLVPFFKAGSQYRYSQSAYQSVCRAVRSLERKGFVKQQILWCMGETGRSRINAVKLVSV